MPIKYAVAPGTIVLCDYDTGFRVPEMVKRRPVVVISPRLPRRDGLCTVIPLSGTPPSHVVPYQCLLTLAEPLPAPFDSAQWWVKADMLATVGFDRLDLFRTGRDHEGKRKYLHPKLSVQQLELVQVSVLHALGLGYLTRQPT